MEDVDDGPGTAGHQFGRLEDDGIAVTKRRRDLPGGNGDREVPGRDDADDADRLAGDLDADIGSRRRQHFARQSQAFAGEEVEDLAGTHRLADAFDKRLAFLARQQPSELVLAGKDLVGGLPQDRVALEDAGARPGRERSLGRGDRGAGIVGRRTGIFAHNVIGVGRVDVGNPVTADPLAGNQVLVQCHRLRASFINAHDRPSRTVRLGDVSELANGDLFFRSDR
ncbi:hypothetical protein D9M69_93570 [compost metagenome]